MFLMGPLAQFKKMFEKGRIIATSLYFGAMFLTLWMAVKVQSKAHSAEHSTQHAQQQYALLPVWDSRPLNNAMQCCINLA